MPIAEVDPLAGATIVAYPDYTASNPYQNGLYSAFRSKGRVEFGPIHRAVELARAAPRDRRTIFHLHWPDPLFADVADDFDYQIRASDFLRAVEAFKASGGIFLWTVHNRLPHDAGQAACAIAFHRQLAMAANLIHLHSATALAEVRDLYALDERKCIIVPHGSYEGCYGPAFGRYQSRQLLGLRDVESLILFFGQIRPYKGLDELIRAFHDITAQPDRDQVHLLIAGKPLGGFSPEHARLMEENDPRIHILDGFVPATKIPLLFGAADVVALPYREVLTSGSLLLAAHYGKPVVAPRLPALAPVDEAGIGITYEPEAPGALAEALRQAIDLDQDRRGRMAAASRTLSSSLAWDRVSETFRDRVAEAVAPGRETIRVGRMMRTVQCIRKPARAARIGLAIVSNGHARRIGEQLAELGQLADASIAIYIYDDAANGVPHYGLQGIADTLVHGDAPIGRTAATNVLLSMIRADGCEHALILDPEAQLTEAGLRALLADARDDAIISAAITGENGRIIQAGYRCFHDHAGYLDIDPLLADDDPAIAREPYMAHALDHRILAFPTALIDKVGLLPEAFACPDATLEWSMAARRKGVALVVDPSIMARAVPMASPGPFPGIDPLYYAIRDRFTLERKWARKAARIDADAIGDRIDRARIAPLRQAIGKGQPDLLPLFERCVAAGIADGRAGVRGMIDVGGRIDAIRLPDEREGIGRIDRRDAQQLRGWVAERDPGAQPGWRPGSAWLLRDGRPYSRILPSLPRADVADAGYCEGAGFTLPLPRQAGDDRHRYDLRMAADGRRLPFSDEVGGEDWRAGGSVGTPREPRLRASIETVADGILTGWAADLAHGDVSLRLDVVIENEVVASGIRADIHREDLKRAGIGEGRHGFRLQLRNRHLLQESLQVELLLSGRDQSLTRKSVAVQNDNGGFSPHFSMRRFLQWAYCEDRMGAGRSELATSLLRQFDMEKALLRARADRAGRTDLVSVIMPACNRAQLIAASIQSVLDQSYPHFELIVVDDGSTDDTAAVVERFDDPRIILLRLAGNMGVSAARNHGLKAARGELIAYLDSDNQWDADYLAIMTDGLGERPGYQSAYAGQIVCQTVPGTGGRPDRVEQKSIRFCPFNRSRLEERNYIDLNIFMHRRHLHGLHGGFDERLRRLVDWDLILRYTSDWPPLMIPALLGRYHAGKADNQITLTEDFNSNRARLRIPTPAMAVATARQEPRGLDMLVLASSPEDMRLWTMANDRLIQSAIGRLVGVWSDPGGASAHGLLSGPGGPAPDDTHETETLETVTAALERLSDAGRPLLITRSELAIRGDWGRTIERLRSTEMFAAATGRLYGRSTRSRFGRVYHDLTPARIQDHILDWTISPSLSGQKSRVIPRDYLFIPAEHVDRIRMAARLSRDMDDMLDRYFDSFALGDAPCVYVPDLIACHRDDVLPWH